MRIGFLGLPFAPTTKASAQNPDENRLASTPLLIAVDGSGDVWAAGTYGVTELIGVAAPVVTPLAYGAAHGTLGTRP